MPHRARRTALCVVVVLSLVALACETATDTPTPAPTASPGTLGYTDTASLLERMITTVPKDAIPAILDPQFLPAEEVPPLFRDEEEVIGVVINGDARAYPIDIFSWHEAANDVVGGVPIVVTW